jgi:hypothetical protein
MAKVESQKHRVFSHMKEAISTLGKDDHLISGLLDDWAPPAQPTHGLAAHRLLFTLQAIRDGQGAHEQGEDDMHPHCPLGFLRRMLQLPLLLGFFDAAVLDDIVPSFFPTVLCTHDELHLEPHGAILLAG